MDIKRRKFIGKTGGVALTGLLATIFGSTLSAHPGRTKLGNRPHGDSDLDDLKHLLNRKEANIWLFTGDSITHGAKHTHGYRSYPEVFQERIRWEIGRVRDVVINTGISGHAAENILSDFDWRISQFNPDVVSVMIGTNDCARTGMTPGQYRNHVSKLIARIRTNGAIPILHTPNVIILEKSPERKTLPEYIPVLRAIAEDEDVVLVDNYAYWQQTSRDQSEEYVYKNWLNDPLHPNQAGHQEIARLMFKTLDIFDPAAPTCGGPYYEGEH